MKLFSFVAIIIALAAAGCASAPQKNHASFNIRDFGAIGDGTNKDTAAFQKALDACAVSGGGEVIVPAGKYLIGSVQVGNRTILRLETNSVIIGSGNTNDYPMMDIRWEGRWQPGRAVVLEPISCNDVHWEGFTVTQGGNWATHPTYCSDVEIKNLKISGNRDGIDVDSCKNVRIEHCDINTGDDSISLKSGRGLDGARIGRPAENILIENCNLVGRRFACVGIGSETSGGIRDVRIENCKMSSHTFGIYIKTRIGRGGTIENIYGENLEVRSGGFLKINLTSAGNLNTADDPVEGLTGYPLGKNFHFSNVTVTNCPKLVDARDISPEKPLEGLSLANITGTCASGITLANISDAKWRNINVTGFTGALIAQTNVNELPPRHSQ